MKVTVKRTVYKQNGSDLNVMYEIENELCTNEYSRTDSVFASEELLREFRKNDVTSGYGVISDWELYLDDELVASLQPYFTHDGETFNTWRACCNACDNYLMQICDTTVTKHLTIDRIKMIHLMDTNCVETFSE